MKNLLLVDFDGTLFNSDEFHSDIKNYLYTTYKTPFEDFHEAYELAKADGKPHSLKKQLQALKLRNVNGLIKEIREHLISLNKNYLYQESLDFINKYKKNIIIYTYADKNYFKYKLSVCKLNRARLPVIVVEGNKNEYLKNNMPSCLKDSLKNRYSEDYSHICWIDDKIDGFNKTVENVDFVRIKRDGDKYSHHITPSTAKEIRNLLEIAVA